MSGRSTMRDGWVPELESHFDVLEHQEHAARLGMLVFLGSELLLFAALFGLYAAYRVIHPQAFSEGVHHDPQLIGTVNTAILIAGSTAVAVAVQWLRAGRRRSAVALTAAAAGAGVAFLVLKSIEYGMHFHEGIYPGGQGRFFAEHGERGLPIFFDLYFAMTGLHAIHVLAGTSLLAWLAWWMTRDRVAAGGAYRLELGALYWHMVDLIWIFLWPMFYLMSSR